MDSLFHEDDVPKRLKIYHITHIDNLAQLVSAGELWSDAKRLELKLNCKLVGMSDIKKKRLVERVVQCYPRTKVGEYAPFYFCPRSVMLYILHVGNAPGLNYRDGQDPIIHLQADLHEVVKWADAEGRQWAFSDVNAAALYAKFYNDLKDLTRINWNAVKATDFSNEVIKEGKQAEFLLHRSFPWKLIEKIGVINSGVAGRVTHVTNKAKDQPPVEVKRGWYF